MIEYIKLFWEGAPEGEPPVILYEVDHRAWSGWPSGSIDIFAGAAPTTSPTFTTEP